MTTKPKRITLYLTEKEVNDLLTVFRKGGLPTTLNRIRTKLYNQVWWIRDTHETEKEKEK